MSQARTSTREGGFTLLEVLIAISILGLILLALTSGVHFAGRAWRTEERESAKQGDLDAVQNALRELVMGGAEFDGDAGSLRFVGRMPAALARGGLYDIQLRARDGRLLVSWRPHFKGPMADAATSTAELAKGVTTFRFSYFEDATGWQSLATQQKPPLLVGIDLRTEAGAALPQLIVRPQVELPAPTKS